MAQAANQLTVGCNQPVERSEEYDAVERAVQAEVSEDRGLEEISFERILNSLTWIPQFLQAGARRFVKEGELKVLLHKSHKTPRSRCSPSRCFLYDLQR